MLSAVPYFNWRYAQDNGFMRWFFFGEFIATGKAMIWPYYAYEHFKDTSQVEEVSGLEHFNNSQKAYNEAVLLMNKFSDKWSASNAGITEVKRLLDISLSEADNFVKERSPDRFPEFYQRYEGDYIESIKLFRSGLGAGNDEVISKAKKLLISYSLWVSANENKEFIK